MNKINLPDFITFKNFNDETLDLISKKEIELSRLHSILSFKKFLDIFEDNPNLKSLELEVVEVNELVGANGGKYLTLDAVHSTFMNGSKCKNDDSNFSLIRIIIDYPQMGYILAMGGLVIGRDMDSYNKLKSLFNIKDISKIDINEITRENIPLVENSISDDYDKIYDLNDQILVIEILMLFKKDDNLKKINLVIDNSIIGPSRLHVEVSFFDDKRCIYEDCDVIVEEIKDIIGYKTLHDPNYLNSNCLVLIEINRGNTSDIKNWINCVFLLSGEPDKFFIILEKEILEESVGQANDMIHHPKMRI